MPANLTPDYLEAERNYREAQTPAGKIAALEKMLATLPKHKGTEKLQADIKRRLSQARKESQKKGSHHAAPFYHIPKEGAGQVALTGPPNSGKSQLVARLTNAQPEVADYPFTTRLPAAGMMRYQNVPIQLIDLPAVSRDYLEPWLPQAIRNADLSVLVADVNDPDVLGGIEFTLELFKEKRLRPPELLAGNKIDLPGGDENFAALAELYADRLRAVPVSAATGRNLDGFGRALFDALGLVRVYTKAPGKKVDFTAPFILRRGQTVEDAARMVHKDFAEHLRFARLFHVAGGHDGLMVERSHVLQDEDILEFHI